MAKSRGSNGGAPPLIDPTILTTDQINQAKEDLRREAVSDKTEASTNLQSLRIEVMSEIRRVNDVTDQKFNGVDKQFDERDTRTEHSADEGRISLDAALAAAKEAVGEQNKSFAASIAKSETNTTKLIDGLQQLMSTNNESTNEKIDDLKARLDRGEGTTRGEDRSGAAAIVTATARSTRLGIVIAGLSAGGYGLYLVIAIATHGKF